VQVIAASCTAVDNLFAISLEFAAADRTVIFNGLAIAVHFMIAGTRCSRRRWWSMLEDLNKLGGDEGKLVDKIGGSPEALMKYIYNMLARRLALLIGRTRTSRNMSDVNTAMISALF